MPHQAALDGFFQRFFTPEDFDSLLPSIEKSLVRTPELAFQSLTSLLSSSSLPVLPFVPKLLPHVLSNMKSAKPEVRAGAGSFFRVLFERANGEDAEAKAKVMDELLAVLKTGKSVSADHRIALFNAIQSLPIDEAYSAKVAAVLPPLIAKETTSEPALAALLAALEPHLAFALAHNLSIPQPALTALTKEVSSPKALVRVPIVRSVGEVLWKLAATMDERTESSASQAWPVDADKFAETVAKALADVSLKNVANGPLTAVAGVGEGFVAAGALLGPLRKSGSKAVGQCGRFGWV